MKSFTPIRRQKPGKPELLTPVGARLPYGAKRSMKSRNGGETGEIYFATSGENYFAIDRHSFARKSHLMGQPLSPAGR